MNVMIKNFKDKMSYFNNFYLKIIIIKLIKILLI